jgi:hypothetical protein
MSRFSALDSDFTQTPKRKQQVHSATSASVSNTGGSSWRKPEEKREERQSNDFVDVRRKKPSDNDRQNQSSQQQPVAFKRDPYKVKINVVAQKKSVVEMLMNFRGWDTFNENLKVLLKEFDEISTMEGESLTIEERQQLERHASSKGRSTVTGELLAKSLRIREADKRKSTASADKAKLIETCFSWALHEPFEQDEELKKHLKEVHEGDGYKLLHWVFWPRFKSHPDELERMMNFDRSDSDIITCVELCQTIGYHALDMNTKKETSIGSLIAASQSKKNYIGQETFRKVYRMLTTPTDEITVMLCRQIVNKMSSSDVQKDFGPALCWLMRHNSSLFVSTLVTQLMMLKTSASDSRGFYESIVDRIVLIAEKLEKSGVDSSEFSFYFRNVNGGRGNLRDLFVNEIGKYVWKKTVIEEAARNSLNPEIIGAIIGTIASSETSEKFVEFVGPMFPSMTRILQEEDGVVNVASGPYIARTCWIHAKERTKNYSPSEKTLTFFKTLPFGNMGTKFNFEETIAAVSGVKVNLVVKVKVIEKEEVREEVNPFVDNATIAYPPVNNQAALRDFLDELDYTIEKNPKKIKKIHEALLMKCFESVKELQIADVAKIIRDLKIDRDLCAEVCSQMQEDNPKWAPKLLEAI